MVARLLYMHDVALMLTTIGTGVHIKYPLVKYLYFFHIGCLRILKLPLPLDSALGTQHSLLGLILLLGDNSFFDA